MRPMDSHKIVYSLESAYVNVNMKPADTRGSKNNNNARSERSRVGLFLLLFVFFFSPTAALLWLWVSRGVPHRCQTGVWRDSIEMPWKLAFDPDELSLDGWEFEKYPQIFDILPRFSLTNT